MNNNTLDIFVTGEPQPFPKKRTTKSGMIYSHDPDGIKRGWMNVIVLTAKEEMKSTGFVMLDDKTPVSLLCVFYRTKPKSSPKKMKLPYKKPDVDNYAYSVMNALSGVCYHDDSRVVDQNISKRWADEENEAGVRIIIQEVV